MIFKRSAKKSSKTKAKAKAPAKTLNREQTLILGGFLTLFGLALLISFASYLLNWQSDQSLIGSFDKNIPADNYLNHLGNAYLHHLRLIIGLWSQRLSICSFGSTGNEHCSP